jgi:predicted RND superfamily exporter protein
MRLPGLPDMTVLTRSCLRRPKTFLLGVALLTAGFAVGLTRLQMRTDGAALYPLGEPAIELTRRDGEVFQDPRRIILLVSSRPGGPPVASPAGFDALERLHASITHLRAVAPGGVKSLASLVEPIEGTTALVDVDHYLDDIPTAPEPFARLLARLHAHPLVDGLFLSQNGRHAALYVSLDPGADREAGLAEVDRWLARQDRRSFDLRLTGPVVAEIELGHTVVRDLAWLTPLMAVVVALLLFLSLRTLAAVVIAGAEVLVVMVLTLGAMGFLGVPITLVTTIMPVILLAMTVADEVHLLERLQTDLDAEAASRGGGEIRREDVRRLMEHNLTHLHRPIVLSSLTIAIGFLSFPTGTLEPLRQFGLFSGLGLVVALLMSFTLIPALAATLPPSFFRQLHLLRRNGAAVAGPPIEARLGDHEAVAFWLCCTLIAVSLVGVSRLIVQDSWVDNFDPRAPLVSAERDYNANFWGSYLYDVVLRSEDPGFFRRPEGVVLAEKVAAALERGPHVGRALSYLVPMRVIGDIVGKPGPLSQLERQDLRTLNAVGLVLRKQLDLNQLTTLDGRSIRVRLFVKSPNYARSAALDDFVRREVPRVLAGSGVQHHFSGDIPLSVSVIHAIVTNQLSSISWTLVGVAAIVLLAYRSLWIALLVSAPVTAAAAMVFGGMGYVGVPLGIASSMFAALSVGASVDFALHWWHVYEREREAGRDHRPAARTALEVSGPAIRWNALVLSLSFLVLSLSALKPNHTLGWLLATAIGSAYLTTLLLMPRLVRGFQILSSDRKSAIQDIV